jgi:hypothetical protein
MNSKLIAMVISFLTIISFTTLSAHSPDQSYLYLRIYESHVEGTQEMTYRDINKALGLNLKRGMKVEDLRPFLPVIHAYLKERVSLSAGGQRFPFEFIEPEIMETKMGVFLRSHYELPSMKEVPKELDVKYNVLFDRDEDHQGFLVIGHHWKSGIVKNEGMPSLLFSKGRTENTLNLEDASIWKGFLKMIRLGAYHIWIGLDHILFLLALILPSVVRRKQKPDGTWTWEAVDDFKTAFWYIIKIVTWFTIAHSVTLSMAALGVIDLPPRIVESIIALSIALAAYHNIRPIFGHREWLIALGFGLFHGMGFASVLGDKGLEGEYLTLSLLGFNIGVEVGQIFIICLMFPILFILRKRSVYRSILLYGSILLILISIYWFVERFFEVNFIIDDYIAKAFRKIKRMM